MTDESSVLAANAAFYAAFRAGDIEAMQRLWAESGVSCIHPGWPVLVGRDSVMRSWQGILRAESRPAIDRREEIAIVAGDEGRVLCLEVVGNATLAATNQFRRIDGVWRMTHHQASLVAEGVAKPASEPSRRLH